MNIPPELLKRYHLGECTAEERKAVDAWLEDGSLIPAQGTREVSGSDLVESRSRVWELINERVVEEVPRPTVQHRTYHRWWPYIAASLLLMTIFGQGLYKQYRKTDQPVQTMLSSHVPYGERRVLNFSDGTKVFLNGGSTLHYPESFSGQSREVELIGEAYFEVTADKQNPFVIHTPYNTQVKVVGTVFNVKAEPQTPRVEVAVAEGTVHFMTERDQENFMELNAGQFAIYDNATRSLTNGMASIPSIGHWKDNKLVFDEEPLEDAFRKLEKWYGYTVTVSGKWILNQRYTARYETVPKVDELLHSMAFVLNFKYRINNEDKTIDIY